VRVHLCGVRGSTPTPGADFLRYGGHTSCLAIAHDQAAVPTLILDAGTGVRTVSKLLGARPFDGTILLSHLHWDHVQGLPFFAAADRDDARVELLLPEQPDGTGAEAVLERMMSPPHFPIRPGQLHGDWTFGSISPGERQAEGFSLLARRIPHRGGHAFGYRVSDGRSALAYIPDHCPTELGPGPEGFGEYHPAALELASHADVLVHDCQLLTDEELNAEGRFGHAVADYAIELGRRAGAGAVVLFHHRPNRTDDQLDELARRFGAASGVSVAVQGSVLDL
jgi:phosphoribosyl 1,2-cyclic phosphodiesterase